MVRILPRFEQHSTLRELHKTTILSPTSTDGTCCVDHLGSGVLGPLAYSRALSNTCRHTCWCRTHILLLSLDAWEPPVRPYISATTTLTPLKDRVECPTG